METDHSEKFEIEIFNQYKVSVLVGDLTPPRERGKYPLEMVNFQDWYLSKKLISISKTNGFEHYIWNSFKQSYRQ